MADILVIDDDELMRMTLRYLLEPRGHTVVEAADGGEGMRLFKENKPDLIVTDVMMPGRSGIEVLEKLRQDFPGVKIIVISGGSKGDMSDMLRMASILGAARVFRKPINQQEMLEAVAEVLAPEGNA